MSAYTEFEEKLLVAAYQFAELSSIPSPTVRQIVDHYGLEYRQAWLGLALEAFRENGFNREDEQSDGAEGELGKRIWLSANGYKEAERLNDEKNIWVPTPEERWKVDLALGRVYSTGFAGSSSKEGAIDFALSAGPSQDEIMAHVASEPILTFQPPPSDSAKWTGKQLILVDSKVIAQIRESAQKLRVTVDAMHFESNSDSHNLKGLVDALVAVCSMAEPEVSIIGRILASPKFQAYAGLATLIATIRGVLGI